MEIVLLILLGIFFGPPLLMGFISLIFKTSDLIEKIKFNSAYRTKETKEEQRKKALESEYPLLISKINEETRSYIYKMSISPVISQLTTLLLQNGIPESFEVATNGVFWKYENDSQEYSVLFQHLDLPSLTYTHRFSQQIDNATHWKEGFRLPQNNEDDIFGISSYIQHYAIDEFGCDRVCKCPCINECTVIGVLLARNIGKEYTYDIAKFTRKYTPTKQW